MKHIFISLLSLIAVCAYGQADSRIYFEGQQINGLTVDGAYEVKLSQGEKTGVTVVGTPKVLEKINVTISENGIINVVDQGGIGKFFKSNKPVVRVVVSRLNMLSVGGTCSVIGSGEFTADSTSAISVSSSSFLEFVKIKAPKVELVAAGQAKVGGVTINATDVKITNGGACDVTILGECENLNISTNGTSVLNTLMFGANHIEATCMGVSLVKAIINNTAKVNVGGTATFKYTGAGKVEGKAVRL